MKLRKKQWMAILLCIGMLFSMVGDVGLTAFSADTEESSQPDTSMDETPGGGWNGSR